MPHLPKPDLVVNLEASLPVLKERIQKRARDFEAEVDASYLELLSRLQQEWTKTDHPFRIISVNTDRIDLAQNPADQKEFVEAVRGSLL